MRRILNGLFFTALLFAVAGTGIYAGYNAINLKEDKPMSNPLENRIGKITEEERPVNDTPLEKPAEETSGILTDKETLLVFEYVYEDNGSVETFEEKMPAYLVGKPEGDFVQGFAGWQLMDFGADKVVLEKRIAEAHIQKFILSVVDGYIAVFYDEGVDGSKLKEVTDTPISSLPEDEQLRLKEGIEIEGEESLISILQDFGS